MDSETNKLIDHIISTVEAISLTLDNCNDKTTLFIIREKFSAIYKKIQLEKSSFDVKLCEDILKEFNTKIDKKLSTL